MLRQVARRNAASLGWGGSFLVTVPVGQVLPAGRFIQSSAVAQAARAFPSISVDEANKLHTAGYTYLDVRTEEEFVAGRPQKAVLAPLLLRNPIGQMVPNPSFRELAQRVVPDKATKLLVGCRSGVRSKAAAAILLDMGYSSVTDVEGGWTAWVAAGLPTEQ